MMNRHAAMAQPLIFRIAATFFVATGLSASIQGEVLIQQPSDDLIEQNRPVALKPLDGIEKQKKGESGILGTVDVLATASTPDARVVAPIPVAPRKAIGRTFRYGVCSHISRYSPADQKKLLDVIGRLGVDFVRDGKDWNWVEPSEGKWDFTTLDEMVDGLNVRGIELQTILGYTARWASTGDINAKDWTDWNRAAPRMDAFKRYVDAVVARYKDRIDLWEIWNEPDISFWKSTTAQFNDLFKVGSASIVAGDPNGKVLNGGFAMVRRPPNPNFLQEFVRDADASNWHIWAYHDYHTFDQMLVRARENRQLYQSKGLKIPIWINEGGFHCLLPGGEEEQAIAIAKKLSAAPALGVSAYAWYDIIDDGDKPLDPEHHFGLLRRDFSPKPAFIAYQQLIRQLAPRRFDRQLPEQSDIPGLWGLIYRAVEAGSDDVLVLWRNGKGLQTPVWIGTEGGSSKVSVEAIDGAKIDAPLLEGNPLVTISDAPIYIRIPAGTEPTVHPVLSLPDKLAVLPSKPNTLRLRVTNPTPRAVTFNVAMAGDAPTIRLDSTQQVVKLAAGESASISTDVRLAVSEAVTQKGNGAIAITLRTADQPKADQPGEDQPRLEARVPYTIALPIPKVVDTVTSLSADTGIRFDLSTSESVVNLFSAEPNELMHWHGAQDLSATARIAYSATALYLTVDTTDDVHDQKATGESMWEGDSLQVAIRTNDNQPAYFEAALALGPDGKPHGWVHSLPGGSKLAVGPFDSRTPFSVQRESTRTHYTLRVSWESLGLKGPPSDGLRLNFLVNDNDGHGRKGWVQLAEGIGRVKNASLFPLLVCDPSAR